MGLPGVAIQRGRCKANRELEQSEVALLHEVRESGARVEKRLRVALSIGVHTSEWLVGMRPTNEQRNSAEIQMFDCL